MKNNLSPNRQGKGYYTIYFTHLKLCLATAKHNFNWVEITHVCLI